MSVHHSEEDKNKADQPESRRPIKPREAHLLERYKNEGRKKFSEEFLPASDRARPDAPDPEPPAVEESRPAVATEAQKPPGRKRPSKQTPKPFAPKERPEPRDEPAPAEPRLTAREPETDDAPAPHPFTYAYALHQARLLWLRRTPFGPVALGALILGLLFLPLFHHFGYRAGLADGMQQAEASLAPADAPLADAVLDQLDAALRALRSGRGVQALAILGELEKTHPGLPSLAYLTAQAAVETRQFSLADTRTQAAINRHERVADALVLQAAIEASRALDRDHIPLGDPRLRAEELLRQAIATDPSDPHPFLELAALYRSQGKLAQADKLLAQASLRTKNDDNPLVVQIIEAPPRPNPAPPGPRSTSPSLSPPPPSP